MCLTPVQSLEIFILTCIICFSENGELFWKKVDIGMLRWLDWITSHVWALISYVAIIKDMGKSLPQLYYIKMEISYDEGFIAIGVAMVTKWRHYLFYLSFCFSVLGGFLRNRLREYVPAIIAWIIAKFEQILWERFGNTLKQIFKNHKNSEIACYPPNWLIF